MNVGETYLNLMNLASVEPVNENLFEVRASGIFGFGGGDAPDVKTKGPVKGPAKSKGLFGFLGSLVGGAAKEVESAGASSE